MTGFPTVYYIMIGKHLFSWNIFLNKNFIRPNMSIVCNTLYFFTLTHSYANFITLNHAYCELILINWLQLFIKQLKEYSITVGHSFVCSSYRNHLWNTWRTVIHKKEWKTGNKSNPSDLTASTTLINLETKL